LHGLIRFSQESFISSSYSDSHRELVCADCPVGDNCWWATCERNAVGALEIKFKLESNATCYYATSYYASTSWRKNAQFYFGVAFLCMFGPCFLCMVYAFLNHQIAQSEPYQPSQPSSSLPVKDQDYIEFEDDNKEKKSSVEVMERGNDRRNDDNVIEVNVALL
jgi:hypothetical protein